MHRFFVDRESINNSVITISGSDALHISKVLRLRSGENIIVSDTAGKEYLCEIQSMDKTNVYCSIVEEYENISEPEILVDLFQGVPKSTKMDLIVQKCTELGINSFFPVSTKRVVIKTNFDSDYSGKLSRYQKIAMEAAKQSGRGHIPEVGKVMDFEEAVRLIDDYDLALIPYENEKDRGLKQVLRSGKDINRIAVFIGPEGGFAHEEIELAVKKGAVPVTLGHRILRTETAGFACLSIIMYELGDMGGCTWKK